VRADRLISILLLLQVHGRLTARDLAERLEISERTVLRDMDALTGAAVLDESGSISPEGFDLATYWESSMAEFRERLPRYYATFRVAPSVMRWARYRGWRLEEEREEGSRTWIRVRFDAEEEGLQFALSFGGELEVIEPTELRNKVLEAARDTVERYSSAGRITRSICE
jgi:predicted DNA-binding transcriptional regulator YafY